MAIVETFGVKPTGFLAAWRYVNVNVSDTGAVTNTNVPGKPNVNLDRVSDYRSNNRAYNNGQLITTFCNLSTFTRYNVYAQDERPFAYVTTGLNDPTCGYETPLPEPAVPYNPFGQPNYGGYKTFAYCDRWGRSVNVLIEKKEYTGSVSVLEVGGQEPVIISDKQVDNKFDPIRIKECTLSFLSTENFQLSEFFENDERTFRVTVTFDGIVDFKGYVTPDSCSEPFAPPNYIVSIKCTDGIGSLKTMSYPFPIGASFNLRQNFIDVLTYCLAPINLNIDLVTICNLYETSMPTSLNDDPLALVTFNPLRLADDTGKILTSYEVLVAVCTAWGAYIVQTNGKWVFARANELSKLVVRQRTYNYTGLFLGAENIENDRSIGNVFNDDMIATSGANLENQDAYKRVSVLSDFGKVPSILYNGDFEAWNGFNWTYWTKYGGIDVSREQRTIVNSTGATTLIQNYALKFNKRNADGKYLEHSPIPVQVGDTIKYSFRVGKTPNNTLSSSPFYTTFWMRIKVGEWYLYNANGGNTYTWVKSLATVILRVDNPDGDLNTFTVGFQIPECPTTGQMIVQLYGFGDGLEAGATGTYTNDLVGLIDDIKLTKSSQSSENDIVGMLSICDNVRLCRQKPPQIDILWGDYFYRPLATQELDNLYTLFIGTNYTKGWYEYGVANAPLAFGLCLAKSIIRAYQQPFYIWTGDIQLSEDDRPLSYMDVMSFIVPDNPKFSAKRFAYLGGDFNLKSNIIKNAKLAEIFDNTAVTVDNTVPYYPNMPDPLFVQDTNYVKVNGIFTDEFTQEFN